MPEKVTGFSESEMKLPRLMITCSFFNKQFSHLSASTLVCKHAHHRDSQHYSALAQ
jgi:hypothetical protein